ncbi:hypothetical protein P9112_009030 [Eukaryota sp. TZLM1-RC]
MSLEQLRSEASSWSLASDADLLTWMRSFATRLVKQAQTVEDDVNSLVNTVKKLSVDANNSMNDFLVLSSTQFVENRVSEADVSEDTSAQDETKEYSREEKDGIVISRYRTALSNVFKYMREEEEKEKASQPAEDNEAIEPAGLSDFNPDSDIEVKPSNPLENPTIVAKPDNKDDVFNFDSTDSEDEFTLKAAEIEPEKKKEPEQPKQTDLFNFESSDSDDQGLLSKKPEIAKESEKEEVPEKETISFDSSSEEESADQVAPSKPPKPVFSFDSSDSEPEVQQKPSIVAQSSSSESEPELPPQKPKKPTFSFDSSDSEEEAPPPPVAPPAAVIPPPPEPSVSDDDSDAPPPPPMLKVLPGPTKPHQQSSDSDSDWTTDSDDDAPAPPPPKKSEVVEVKKEVPKEDFFSSSDEEDQPPSPVKPSSPVAKPVVPSPPIIEPTKAVEEKKLDSTPSTRGASGRRLPTRKGARRKSSGASTVTKPKPPVKQAKPKAPRKFESDSDSDDFSLDLKIKSAPKPSSTADPLSEVLNQEPKKSKKSKNRKSKIKSSTGVNLFD